MAFKKGHIQFNSGRTHFKKGITPWNDGKRYTISKPKKVTLKICKQCKKEFKIADWRLKDKTKTRGIFCSLKCNNYFHRGKNSPFYGVNRSGENSPTWKGGITPINVKIRHSEEYKLWRIAVFERDNYTCIWCGVRNGDGKSIKLHADHIKPFAYYPELRFAIDNGRTLCVECHKTTETYGGKVKKLYSKI